MSPDFDKLVETSTSLGEAATEGERLTLHSLSRSSNDAAMPDVVATLDAAARLAGGTLEVKHNYNGWRPDLDSELLAVARTVSEGLFGEPPVVTAIHAGLETSVIGGKVSRHLDMLAIGPQIEGPHSPDERVSIPTVERFWKLLVGIVEETLGGEALTMTRGRLVWLLAAAGVVLVLIAVRGDRRQRQERRNSSRRRVGTERVRRRRRLARRARRHRRRGAEPQRTDSGG